ncbi:ABC transporter substrate-binding protein [Nocardioides mesophilus]|uniref:ABC transporter substrate-binding protein n=1 Tax=Nocardioides mesophilus TaxID=433659 RepID=A0A7G9RF55_9ACTN|nr:ABC transporter substrate-binding protein [Nocardioides mesophilus]QNN54230.1 ABC transporter substrate-binding protein [Nocardioides mesophilus]
MSVALPAAVTPNWIFPMASLEFFSVYNISWLQQPMYRPLYWFGGHNDQPTLDAGLSVAEKPSFSSDGTSVTMKIKPWKWSNGEAVNADNVIFWMNMIKAEKANWAAYVPGEFPDNVTKVSKIDDQTVKFDLDSKYSSNWFTYNELSQVTPMPMAWDVTSTSAKAGSGGCTTDMAKCKAVYDFLVSQSKDQQSYASSKIWSVVNGPWKLGSYSSSGNFTFVPNKDYSGSPKPKLDEVKFLPFTSDSAEYNVLKSGSTIDIGTVPPQDLPQKPADSDVPGTNPLGANYYLAPEFTWSVNYFPINFNNPTLGPAFKQLYVRQALQMTLNQPVGIDKALLGYGYENYSPVPVKPDNQWLSPEAQAGNPYPFDANKAKSLLTSHGWTDQGGVMTCTKPGTAADQCGAGVKSGTKLSVKYDYASGSQPFNQQMQQYKSDAAKAGIELNMKQMPFNSVLGESVTCKPTEPACAWQVTNWGGGWIYAPDFLPTGESLFATGAGSNSGSYSDPKMDQLITASQKLNGTGPLYDYENYTMEQLPVIFQSNSYNIKAVSTTVGGVIFNPLLTLTPEYWYRTQ